jgi:thiamine kinase-like enzyme
MCGSGGAGVGGAMSEALERARRRAAGLAIWKGPVEPAALSGGITNFNFVVADAGRRVVVRVGDDLPVHGVVRATELAASRAAAAAGVAPAVLYAEPGILVVDWLDARPLTAAEVGSAAMLERIAALLRRCHREVPRHFRGPAPIFWVFQVVREYAHRLGEDGSPHAAELPRLLAAAEALEAATGPVEIVFGHNDLLPANILDDGRRLWLVDWEYAGFNSPLFDLGGLVSNAEVPDALHADLLAAYYGRRPDPALLRGFAAMTAASLLRETLWSMVSERHSEVEFDYAGYTAANRARFEAAWAAFGE